MNLFTRRDFLKISCNLGAATNIQLSAIASSSLLSTLLSCKKNVSKIEPLAGGVFVENLAFQGEGDAPPNMHFGQGLDARKFFDLKSLTSQDLVTENDNFYIRTGYPDQLTPPEPWTIRIAGKTQGSIRITLDELRPKVRPMGVHLLECAGNTLFAHFGLMSAAEWSGVPVKNLLAIAGITEPNALVRISGFDDHSKLSRDSTKGASWIFTKTQLEESGAFLSTQMNRKPLSKDHGAPIRLVVPGWYACCHLKWLNEIAEVREDIPATNHMLEFASRTHQFGKPKLASNFKPALIEISALPIRIEKWQLSGQIVYRVIGIIWGGPQRPKALQIRFRKGEEFVEVESYNPEERHTWALWSHLWRPSQPGSYQIRLRVREKGILAHRLDAGYYSRKVKIV